MHTENKDINQKYDRVIAVMENSAGNESVGDMWLDTKSFPDDTPIREIMDWARQCNGRLIITWDQDTLKK